MYPTQCQVTDTEGDSGLCCVPSLSFPFGGGGGGGGVIFVTRLILFQTDLLLLRYTLTTNDQTDESRHSIYKSVAQILTSSKYLSKQNKERKSKRHRVQFKGD